MADISYFHAQGKRSKVLKALKTGTKAPPVEDAAASDPLPTMPDAALQQTAGPPGSSAHPAAEAASQQPGGQSANGSGGAVLQPGASAVAGKAAAETAGGRAEAIDVEDISLDFGAGSPRASATTAEDASSSMSAPSTAEAAALVPPAPDDAAPASSPPAAPVSASLAPARVAAAASGEAQSQAGASAPVGQQAESAAFAAQHVELEAGGGLATLQGEASSPLLGLRSHPVEGDANWSPDSSTAPSPQRPSPSPEPSASRSAGRNGASEGLHGSAAPEAGGEAAGTAAEQSPADTERSQVGEGSPSGKGSGLPKLPVKQGENASTAGTSMDEAIQAQLHVPLPLPASQPTATHPPPLPSSHPASNPSGLGRPPQSPTAAITREPSALPSSEPIGAVCETNLELPAKSTITGAPSAVGSPLRAAEGGAASGTGMRLIRQRSRTSARLLKLVALGESSGGGSIALTARSELASSRQDSLTISGSAVSLTRQGSGAAAGQGSGAVTTPGGVGGKAAEPRLPDEATVGPLSLGVGDDSPPPVTRNSSSSATGGELGTPESSGAGAVGGAQRSFDPNRRTWIPPSSTVPTEEAANYGGTSAVCYV